MVPHFHLPARAALINEVRIRQVPEAHWFFQSADEYLKSLMSEYVELVLHAGDDSRS